MKSSQHRPQRLAAQHMHVEMRHFLAAIDARIGDCAEPAAGQALLLGDSGHRAPEGGDLLRLRVGAEIRDVGISPLRDHEDMHRRLRVNILERQHMVVLVNRRIGDIAAQDLREYIIVVVRAHLYPPFVIRE